MAPPPPPGGGEEKLKATLDCMLFMSFFGRVSVENNITVGAIDSTTVYTLNRSELVQVVGTQHYAIEQHWLSTHTQEGGEGGPASLETW